MNKNENEYYKKLDFFEDCDNNDGKLKLTRNNANFIETVLAIDSNYKDSSDPNKIPSIDYIDYLKKEENIDIYNKKIHEYGSGNFWINQFVKIIESNDKNHEVEVTLKYEKDVNKGKEEKRSLGLKTILNGVVCAIDRENSTHLTAHHSKQRVGRSNVSKRIYNYIEENGIENFKDKLIKQDDFYLLGYITVPSNDKEENYHYSFATKFCKYISLNMNPKCDKYYIYDNIVISNIDYYIEQYKLKEKYNKKMLEFDKKRIKSESDEEKYEEIANQYKKLYKCLDEIRENAKKEAKDKEKVSRNEMDHIIWYFNK